MFDNLSQTNQKTEIGSRFEEKLQATMGFVQVRLEVVAIGINNIAAFVRA